MEPFDIIITTDGFVRTPESLSISFDRAERWKLLQKLEEENEDAFSELLDKVDDFIYDYDGEETELTYIKKYPEKFVFDGYYRAYE